VWVKICGTTSEADAELALSAGAGGLGFLIGLEYPSDDEIEPGAARAIIEKLPPFVASVLVTHRDDPAWIARTAREIGCNTIQLHGRLAAERLPTLRELVPWAKLVKTIHVDGPAALAEAEATAEFADALLLDTRTETRLGGTGLTHDWTVSAAIVRRVRKPVVLAGGLTPENVRDAIATVRPWAVDVNSGVEDARGRKDPARVQSFVERARAAALSTHPRRFG
jgi:phosphoribosylanthranilate isomerase